jgi:hypothetical protein
MRAFKLMPLFSIVLVLGGLPLFPSNYAYATCCAPCKCFLWCWCAGVNGCPRPACHMDDSASLQVQTMTNSENLGISGSYASSPSPAPQSDRIDRLITLAGSGQCAKNNYTMKFLRSAEVRLKFESDFLKYNASEDNNIVAFQIPMNEEK